MRKTIEDSLPDASESRSGYLSSRVDRILGEFQGEIGAVTLRLGRDEKNDVYVVQLHATPPPNHRTALPFVLETRKPRLADALAHVFEAAERRIRFGPAAVKSGSRRPAA